VRFASAKDRAAFAVEQADAVMEAPDGTFNALDYAIERAQRRTTSHNARYRALNVTPCETTAK